MTALESLWGRLREHPLARLGPGLITGVADDDPSGIATYSQAGAQFGLNMLWTMPLAYPLMSAVQAMCAQIGRVTGKGLAANIRTTFPPIVLKSVDAADWFAGGKSLAEHKLASYWIDIHVNEGTNTKDEKAAYLAEMFKRMGELLGPLHEETYLHVDEVKGDAYGFGGLTQERRYIAGKLDVPPCGRS